MREPMGRPPAFPHWGTVSEETESAAARSRARLLTVVIQYDDLLTSGERATTILLTGESPLELGRAANPVAPVHSPQRLELLDRWASHRHVKIERRGDIDLLFDLGSRNGTFVNGSRIDSGPGQRELELADGDMIEIGHTLLCYRCVEPRLAAALIGHAGPILFGPTRTLSPEVAMLAIELRRIAPAREPVLLLGETGSGKEIAAATVHELSGRSGELRALDCGAIPETLFESKLFGHRRGAFTGATEHRTGEIVAARGGTLFLDELGNLPAASQAKLLRAIEAGEITPIGSGVVEPVDVRWIAATNRDLLNDPGDFRPDLLRRLAGYVGRLPPLRQRREDLGVLSAYFLQQAGVRKASISVPAARRLFLAPLLGNLRQLRTALRASSTLAGEQPIELYHLPPLDEPQRKTPPRSGSSATGSSGTGAGTSAQLGRSMETPSRDDNAVGKSGRRSSPEAIREALRSTGGIVVQAAQRLGTQPRSLYRWLERYQISLSEFREADDPKDTPESPELREPPDAKESRYAKGTPDPDASVEPSARQDSGESDVPGSHEPPDSSSHEKDSAGS